MNYQFNYQELMRRVEILSKSSSDEQLKIYRKKILALKDSLPEKFTDYRNLLHNIALKWHPKKNAVFFLDSAYKMVETSPITTPLMRGFPDPNEQFKFRIMTGLFISLGTIVVASAILASIFLLPPAAPLLFLIMKSALLLLLATAVCLHLFVLHSDITSKGENKLFEANNSLHEIVESFENDLLSVNAVDNDDEEHTEDSENSSSLKSSPGM